MGWQKDGVRNMKTVLAEGNESSVAEAMDDKGNKEERFLSANFAN
jgi:hypothetical protein